MFPGKLQRVGEHLARDMAAELKTAPAVLTYLEEHRK
jgi:hypothetical protein